MQVGCAEECVVGAHGVARWALPEPEGTGALALRAPGGPRTTVTLTALGDHHQLLYQNFIYVAFIHSWHRYGRRLKRGDYLHYVRVIRCC